MLQEAAGAGAGAGAAAAAAAKEAEEKQEEGAGSLPGDAADGGGSHADRGGQGAGGEVLSQPAWANSGHGRGGTHLAGVCGIGGHGHLLHLGHQGSSGKVDP